MDKVWNKNYNNLSAYIENKEHYAEIYTDKGAKRLVAWLNKQLELIKKGKIEEEKLSLLCNLGLDMSPSGLQWEKWLKLFIKLNNFYIENGDSNVSQLEKTIGPWLSSQRVKYRRNELSDAQMYLLNSIGVCWNPSEKQDTQWSKKYKMLIEYQKKHGHVNVQRTKDPDPGIWVSAQRTAYRKGLLSQDRVKLLENIGFTWSVK